MTTNSDDKSLIEKIQEAGTNIVTTAQDAGKNIVTTATIVVGGSLGLGVTPQVNQNEIEDQRPNYSIVCEEPSLKDQLEKNEAEGIVVARSGANDDYASLVYNPPSLENQLEEIYAQQQEVQNQQREKELEISNKDEVASGSPPDPPSEAIDEEMVVNTAVTAILGTEFESQTDSSENEDSESEGESESE